MLGPWILRCTVVIPYIILLHTSLCVRFALGNLWNITIQEMMKSRRGSAPNGEEVFPPLPAITLLDHSLAFRSSAYCVTLVQNHEDHADSSTWTTTIPNSLSRELCDECTECQWKRRRGFTSEWEWQTAVTAELERLMGMGSFNSLENYQQQEGEGHDQELVGSWIVEAPPAMALHADMLDEMSAALGVQLGEGIAVSEDGDRRFFVVACTPGVVKGLLSAGFTSLTPIPPRLKVDPVLEEEHYYAVEEEATAAAHHHVSLASSYHGINSTSTSSKAGGDQRLLQQHQKQLHSGDLAALLVTPPPPPPPAGSSAPFFPFSSPVASKSSAAPSPGAGGASEAIGTTPLLGGAKSRRQQYNLGHAKVEEVLAGGGNQVGIGGLQTRADALEAALDIAMHGHVLWVGPKPGLSPSDIHASKVVQQWPDDTATGAGRDTTTTERKPWASRQPRLTAELGLSGQGEVAGVLDIARLDFRSCFFTDIPGGGEIELKFKAKYENNRKFEQFESKKHRKIRQYVIGHDQGYGAFTSCDNEHGTEVVGAVLGMLFGDPPADGEDLMRLRSGTGVAYSAKVAFYEMLWESIDINPDEEYNIVKKVYNKMLKKKKKGHYRGLSTDLSKHVFPPAYNVGARVYTISINQKDEFVGHFDAVSRPLDIFCYKHQDFITLVSAGNKKKGAPSSVQHPALAKNAVAVGSHANVGTAAGTLGRVDRLSVFSRGGTNDGRIKPDVCGPGENLSLPSRPGVKSTMMQPSCHVSRESGTSYAAPTVAGVTVLVRQYFTKGFYPNGVKKDEEEQGFQPMGALLKAVLVNSGRPLYIKTPEELESVTLPNKDMGWGGVDVSTTLVLPSSPKNQALQVFGEWSKGCKDCPQLYDGDICEYDLKITGDDNVPNDIPLKITLVWYDYPSAINAREVLVNNLDLLAVGSVGKDVATEIDRNHPNGLKSPDNNNNVEHIAIPSPSGGTTYSVKVMGTKVPMSPQPFALVISGPFDSADVNAHYSPKDVKQKKRRGQCGGNDGWWKKKKKKKKKKKTKAKAKRGEMGEI